LLKKLQIKKLQIKIYLRVKTKTSKKSIKPVKYIKMDDDGHVLLYKSNNDATIDEQEYKRVMETVNGKAGVTLIDVAENKFGFFHFLKITRGKSDMERISSVNGYRPTLKPVRYFNLQSFRIYLCELVYNAVNLFPEICEYTITSTNENGTSTLKLGYFENTGVNKFFADDTGGEQFCMGIFKSNFDNERFYMRLSDIKAMYMANRHQDVDHMSVTAVIVSMFMCGSLPNITVSYKDNPDYYKGLLKFK
jgi:hypothetical protein